MPKDLTKKCHTANIKQTCLLTKELKKNIWTRPQIIITSDLFLCFLKSIFLWSLRTKKDLQKLNKFEVPLNLFLKLPLCLWKKDCIITEPHKLAIKNTDEFSQNASLKYIGIFFMVFLSYAACFGSNAKGNTKHHKLLESNSEI